MTAQGLLSIVIPAFNERNTIAPVLAAVAASLPGIRKQIIVIDDGSTDGTREWLRAVFPAGSIAGSKLVPDGSGGLCCVESADAAAMLEFKIIYNEKNSGKGRAIRTGFTHCAGDVIVIQDADLEYDPRDLARMYDLIVDRKVADVVFGCRFYGSPHRSLFFMHYLANRMISGIFNVLYNQTLMDIEVCYKMMTREVLASLVLTCDDFGIEVELSAKIARARVWRIYEVGVSYFGRTYSEGKKIQWMDGVLALWYLVKFRFV